MWRAYGWRVAGLCLVCRRHIVGMWKVPEGVCLLCGKHVARAMCSQSTESAWLVHRRHMTGVRFSPPPSAKKPSQCPPFWWFGLTLNSPKSQWANWAFLPTAVTCFTKGLCVPERTVLSRILKSAPVTNAIVPAPQPPTWLLAQMCSLSPTSCLPPGAPCG